MIKTQENYLAVCGECGTRFPVNVWKHPSRKTIFCPCCRTELEADPDPSWHPNEIWHADKHKQRTYIFTIGAMRQALGTIHMRLFKKSKKQKQSPQILSTPFNTVKPPED